MSILSQAIQAMIEVAVAEAVDRRLGAGQRAAGGGTIVEPGQNGASAYEIWLNAGYVGTEQDFINFLRAPITDRIVRYGASGLEYYDEENNTWRSFSLGTGTIHPRYSFPVNFGVQL